MRPGTIVAIVGVTFHQAAVQRMSIGDRVILAHEPENEYDPNAVVVTNEFGVTLGHLPKTLAPRFTNPEHGGIVGARWSGTVSETTRHEDTAGLRVTLDRCLNENT